MLMCFKVLLSAQSKSARKYQYWKYQRGFLQLLFDATHNV